MRVRNEQQLRFWRHQYFVDFQARALNFILNRFQRFRERGWSEIPADTYAEVWQRFGGSVATHPQFVARLSNFAALPVRYLGWRQGDEIVAAVATWGRYLALSRVALNAQGKKKIFDLGAAEVILPVEENAEAIPLRHAARYVSARHAAQFSGLKRQKGELAILKPTEAFSSKFRYNQRRQLRLFTEAGGEVRPVTAFSPAELAATYIDLFRRRWNKSASGAAGMADVFSLLRDWMTGSVLLLHGAPVAIQVLYRVESPRWISVEYINGGIDPGANQFSPGSVLIYVNTEAERENAAALGKTLRYSFGQTGRDYKTIWCAPAPTYEV
jgi:hypothetical protein